MQPEHDAPSNFDGCGYDARRYEVVATRDTWHVMRDASSVTRASTSGAPPGCVLYTNTWLLQHVTSDSGLHVRWPTSTRKYVTHDAPSATWDLNTWLTHTTWRVQCACSQLPPRAWLDAALSDARSDVTRDALSLTRHWSRDKQQTIGGKQRMKQLSSCLLLFSSHSSSSSPSLIPPPPLLLSFFLLLSFSHSSSSSPSLIPPPPLLLSFLLLSFSHSSSSSPSLIPLPLLLSFLLSFSHFSSSPSLTLQLLCWVHGPWSWRRPWRHAWRMQRDAALNTWQAQTIAEELCEACEAASPPFSHSSAAVCVECNTTEAQSLLHVKTTHETLFSFPENTGENCGE